MLILTRKIQEKIVIGDDIIVTVIQASSNQVRIGIQAPLEVGIYREEVYQRQNDGTEESRSKNDE